MSMKNDKKIAVPNINSLSEEFLETLKEISKSGTKLNTETFSKFLVKRPMIKDILRLAQNAQKDKESQINANMQMLESELETAENNKKQILKDLFDLEVKLDCERDFFKRLVLILINLSRVPGNETFYEMLDEYRQLVIDDDDIDKLENVLGKIKNRMLKEDVKAKKGYHFVDKEEDTEDSKSRPAVFRRFIGDPGEIKLKPLKKAGLKALADLKSTLGTEYYESIETIENRIDECDTVDYLLSQPKLILGVIHDYVQHVEQDRAQITGFIREIGKRLIEMEKGILLAFTSSSESFKENYSFNEDLGYRIRNIGESVGKSKNFQELKSLIILELSTITKTLDEKRKEYKFRNEKASREKEKLQQHFEKMINTVIDQNKTLIKKNQRDSLTNIFNRATFHEFFYIELQRYQRYMEPFTILMFDIDYFKTVNDTYGHGAGDRVLIGIARCVEDILRKTDIFARYGGEEFIILMPNTNLENGLIVAEKLREVVQETEFFYEGQNVPITVSAGITEVNTEDKDFMNIIERADHLMYKAKERGRNKVVSDSDVEK